MARSDPDHKPQYVERRLQDDVLKRLSAHGCVALQGPRQVGKSVLAGQICNHYSQVHLLDLHNTDHFKMLENEAQEFFEAHSYDFIVLDEVQAMPSLFSILRYEIDRREKEMGKERGHFLLLGSAELPLQHGLNDSLAGRISTILLYGLQLDEVLEPMLPGLDEIEFDKEDVSSSTETVLDVEGERHQTMHNLWSRGGFPKSFYAESDEISHTWRTDFIKTYIHGDVKQLGLDVDPDLLMRCWTLLAARQGREWNLQTYANDLKIKQTEVLKLFNALESLLFVRRLRPWFSNGGKTLVKDPCYFIRDSGLLHALLYLKSLEDVTSTEDVGKHWEGFAIESLISASGLDDAQCFFYKSDDKKDELDLVLQLSATDYIAVEIKLNPDETPNAGNNRAADALNAKRRLLVHSGLESQRVTTKYGFESMSLITACTEVHKASNGN